MERLFGGNKAPQQSLARVASFVLGRGCMRPSFWDGSLLQVMGILDAEALEASSFNVAFEVFERAFVRQNLLKELLVLVEEKYPKSWMFQECRQVGCCCGEQLHKDRGSVFRTFF